MGLGLGQGGYVRDYFSGGAAEGTGESFFFAMASQVGVIGVALFICALTAILMSLWRVWRKANSIWLKVSALVTLGALLGYSVSAIASEGAFGLLSSGSVWIMSGLVIQIGNQKIVIG
jgi:apolipoprotein N-acyltransferase